MTVTGAWAGTSETFDIGLFNNGSALGTNPTSSASNANGQLRSLKCAPSGTGTNKRSEAICVGVAANAGGRCSFGFTLDRLPDAYSSGNALRSDMIFEWLQGTTTICFSVAIDTAGKLRILDSANASQATAANGIAVNTFYRICVAYTSSSTSVNEIRVYVNGVLFCTASNITIVRNFQNGAPGLDHWDQSTNVAAAYYTDIFYDDDTSLHDTGLIQCTPKLAVSNGTTNGFGTQIGAGGSGYGSGHAPQVNERAKSDTNGWSKASAGVATTEEYNIEAASVGDVNITGKSVKGVYGWIRATTSVNETAKIIVDGTATNISLTTSTLIFQKVSASPTAYPGGTGADIGMISAAAAHTDSLFECGVTIAYSTEHVGKNLVNGGLVNRGLVNSGLVN